MSWQSVNKQAYTINKRQTARLSKQITTEYFAALKTVNKDLRTLYLKILDGVRPEDYFSTVAKFDRLKKLNASIQKKYLSGANAAAVIQRRISEIAIAEIYYRQHYLSQWVASVGFAPLNQAVIEISTLGTASAWQGLSERAQKKLANTWGDPTKYQPQHGTLTDLLLRNRQADLLKLRREINQGLIQGDSFRKISRRIRKVFNTSVSNALGIARTEGHRNQMAGNFAMTNYARSKGVEAVRQIISTLDSTTREQSATVDSRKEDKNGLFTFPGGVKVAIPGNSGNPAWDINDRESVITIVVDVSPGTRTARNPVTGKVETISYVSFDDWAKNNGLKRSSSGKLIHRS